MSTLASYGRKLRYVRSGMAALALLVLGTGGVAQADIGSDHPAAILVFPKLLVDTSDGLNTIVRISNVSSSPINVFCFYVNVTPFCPFTEGSCFPNERNCSAPGGSLELPCEAQWQPTDFRFRLTQEQPTGWLVSEGERTDCPFLDGVCSQDGTTPCENSRECGPGNHCVQPPCLPLDGGAGRVGPGGQVNSGRIPPAPEERFVGELKCIAQSESERPVARNDLVGQVLLGRIQAGPDETIDVAGYNAIGIPAIPGTGNQDDTLVIGGPAETAEYEGCPNILILDHYFDGAVDPITENRCRDNLCSITGTDCISDGDCIDNICLPSMTCSVTQTPCAAPADCDNTCVTGNQCLANTCSVTGEPCAGNGGCANNYCTLSSEYCLATSECTEPDLAVRVVTDLTLVPCTEDFESRDVELAKTVAQFLVYNEFEQRFSTSTTVDCFKESRLSNLETGQNDRSIFSAGVAGTLTGQTTIRGVVNEVNQGRGGNTLLGVVQEFRCAGPQYDFPLCNYVKDPETLVSSTAKNLHFRGRRPQSDFIYLPAQ